MAWHARAVSFAGASVGRHGMACLCVQAQQRSPHATCQWHDLHLPSTSVADLPLLQARIIKLQTQHGTYGGYRRLQGATLPACVTASVHFAIAVCSAHVACTGMYNIAPPSVAVKVHKHEADAVGQRRTCSRPRNAQSAYKVVVFKKRSRDGGTLLIRRGVPQAVQEHW